MAGQVAVRMDRRGAALGLLCGAWLVDSAARLIARGGESSTIVGVIALAFFGPWVVVLLVDVVRPRELLTVDASGIRFGSIVPALRRFAPWEAIVGVRIYRCRVLPFLPGVRTLGFVPSDRRSPVWRRRRMGQRRYGVAGSIFGMAISMELEELVGVMQGFHPELRFDYGGHRRRVTTTRRRPYSDQHG